MRLLITGGSGFIGASLAPRLSMRHDVFVLLRDSSLASFGGAVETIRQDLIQPLDIKALPDRVDAIIHLAQANGEFPGSAAEIFDVNARSTLNLLEYGRRAGADAFLLASSGDVYGVATVPFVESQTANPTSYYAITKYAAEGLARAYAAYLRPIILRFFHPYGPGQTDRLIPKLAKRVIEGRPIERNSDDRPYLTPMYITDVLTAIERVIERSDTRGVINVAGDQIVSLKELAESIGKTLGIEPLFERKECEVANLAGSNELMKKVLGTWPMTTIAHGLAHTLMPEGASQ